MTINSAITLHERKRLAAMRAVQRQAVRLFTARGFDAVTVQAIAEAAEVSPVSLYRWFGTQERIVLWDEYDPGLFAAVAERLDGQPPLEAVRDALVDELDRIYEADRELVLARTKLVHREPALLAASVDDMRALQAAFAELFAAPVRYSGMALGNQLVELRQDLVVEGGHDGRLGVRVVRAAEVAARRAAQCTPAWAAH